MGVTGQSITLANSIIGVGILAMPYCFQQCGVLLAAVILLLMGLVSRLSSYFLLKSALISRRRNFEFLAFHVFGPAGKLAVEIGIIGFLMGTCIAYFVVVGDLGPQIISKMFKINQSDVLRTSIMVIVSLVCVLPLGLLRNVDSFSNVSAATICFYFCLVIKVVVEAGTVFFDDSWKSKVEMWRPAGVLQCVPIFSMALFCQTQLFEVFESIPSISLEKMNLVTKNAVNICTVVYLTLGIFGYIAFSSHTISGNILVSLSPTLASDVIKLGFVMSLAFSFPLIIFPCRASLYSLLYRKAHPSNHDNIINHSIPEGTFRLITVSIIGVTLFTSLLIPNIELVLGLVGSTIGVLICVVFPAAAFINLTFLDTNERVLAKVILVLGLFILVLGTYANLQAAENKLDKYDDKFITQERIDKMVEEFFESKRLENAEEVIAKPISNDIGKQPQTKEENSKESEVQPPNPVPPEPQSKEKPDKININNELKLKDPEIINGAPKQINANPKNLSNKITEPKQPIVNILSGSNNLTNSKSQSEQEKLELIKQKQLIETMKQHGEEQVELIKEQKEILHELKKTHEEEINKKEDINSNEAKKIAVESIKQIADIAIKRISAVSDKPLDKQHKDQNEVLEAAQDAVKKIEAIKEPDQAKVETNAKIPIPAVANPQQNVAPKEINPIENKLHVNSPDELKPYKEGGHINAMNNVQKQPIPLAALKPAGNEASAPKPPPVAAAPSNQIVQNNIVNSNSNQVKKLIPVQNQGLNINARQKREVIDCTEKFIKQENRLICDTLVKNNINSDVLPPVDLGKDNSLIMPLEIMRRSLKSIEERRR